MTSPMYLRSMLARPTVTRSMVISMVGTRKRKTTTRGIKTTPPATQPRMAVTGARATPAGMARMMGQIQGLADGQSFSLNRTDEPSGLELLMVPSLGNISLNHDLGAGGR